MQRLADTLSINGWEIPYDDNEIREQILLLGKLNNTESGNVKLVLCFPGKKKALAVFTVFFIEHHYPTDEQYSNGVPALLYFAERDFPSAKIINMKLRSTIFKKLIETGAYEALLVDKKGYVTEGSRSNVFFVKGNSIYTAPDGTVLPGIARKYIIEACLDNSIELSYSRVHFREIDEYDAVFISGTSPGLLSLSRINDTSFQYSNKLVKTLMKVYNLKIEEYIQNKL